MSDEQIPQPEPTEPAAESPAATTAMRGRTRRWLAGATLVTVGLVAGSGATYAFTATNSDGGGTGAMAGYGAPAGGRGGGPMGAPPGGTDGTQSGTDGTQGSTTDTQPS